MATFTDLVSGNVMRSGDLNQLANALNTVQCAGLLVKAANGNIAYHALLNSASSGANLFNGKVTGDSFARIVVYLNAANILSYRAGPGNANTYAHMEGSASGWNFLESLTLSANTTINTASTWAGLSGTSTLTVNGNLTAGTTSTDASNLSASNQWNVGANGASWNVTDFSAGSVVVVTASAASSGTALNRDWLLGGTNASNVSTYGLLVPNSGTLTLQTNSTMLFQQYTIGPSLSGITGFAATTGSGGTVTVSHGMNAAPDVVIASIGGTGAIATMAGADVTSIGSGNCVIGLSNSIIKPVQGIAVKR